MGLQQPACASLLLAILVQFTIAKTVGELIMKGHDTPVYVGFSRVIACTWTGAENVTKLAWFLVGRYDLGLGQRLSDHSTGLNPGRITDITWNGRRFSCNAIIVNGRTVGKTFVLMVKEIEYTINITEDKHTVCNCLTLTCTVWCELLVTVEWFSDNEDTVVNTTTITVSEQRTYGLINVINIAFKPLLLSHEGIYKCILAVHKAFRREQSYSVGVSRLRQAYSMSGSIIDILGAENIMLFCKVGNGELVQTVWLLLTENDLQSGHKPVNVLGDDHFILTGDIIVSGGFNTYI